MKHVVYMTEGRILFEWSYLENLEEFSTYYYLLAYLLPTSQKFKDKQMYLLYTI